MDTEACRILVVDDVAAITQIMALFLTRRGYVVRTVNDSRAALNAVRDFRPGAVLLDIAMPYMSGYEVARRIRMEPGFESLPIIAITAYDHKAHVERALQVGISHQLVKPCDFKELEALLQDYCGSGPA